MNIIIVILAILLIPFILAFILGAIKASVIGSDKRRRARAIVVLSQMTREQRIALKDLLDAYKKNDIDKANRLSKQMSAKTINFLVNFFKYDNRPLEYSSGEKGRFIWMKFQSKLRKLGYSEAVSKIIPGVVMDNYDEVLMKMKKKS